MTTGLLVAAALYGVQILRHWDLRSGSELQLKLERQTYLISTFVAYAFAFELISMFLFIFTADSLHGYFVGAMCAAGSLNANHWGYPAIILRIVNFLLAGLWLLVNYTDNQGYDYPLIRMKYFLLANYCPLDSCWKPSCRLTIFSPHPGSDHLLLRGPVFRQGQ